MPYQHLTHDPFSIAHQLAMPAALFSATKKILCAGQRGHKNTVRDLKEAVVSIQRFKVDLLEKGIITTPVPGNTAYLAELMREYDTAMGISTIKQKTSAETTENDSLVLHRYLAFLDILRLYHYNFIDEPIESTIDSILDYLNRAVFIATQLEQQQPVSNQLFAILNRDKHKADLFDAFFNSASDVFGAVEVNAKATHYEFRAGA